MNREAGIEETLYRLAVELIQKRYPRGWGGTAVLRTEQDHYLTSVALETANASAELCIEVPLHGAHALRHLPGALPLLG